MADISMDFEVAAVPTFLFFKSGKLLKRIEGGKADDVTKAVKSLASQKSSGSARPPANKTKEETVSRKETLDESSAQLKKLVNSSPVMLFMKGDPTSKCGFSRQTIEMFSSLNAKYDTFDKPWICEAGFENLFQLANVQWCSLENEYTPFMY
jgi:hypothetical protein